MNDNLRNTTYQLWCKGIGLLSLLTTLVSCTIYKDNKDKGYSASYSYMYTDTSTQGDSLLIRGRIIDPTEKHKATHTIVVSFTPASFSGIAKSDFAWCDTVGNFTIRLKKGTYDIYASHYLSKASFVLSKLGQFGNAVDMKIYMQVRQKEDN